MFLAYRFAAMLIAVVWMGVAIPSRAAPASTSPSPPVLRPIPELRPPIWRYIPSAVHARLDLVTIGEVVDVMSTAKGSLLVVMPRDSVWVSAAGHRTLANQHFILQYLDYVPTIEPGATVLIYSVVSRANQHLEGDYVLYPAKPRR